MEDGGSGETERRNLGDDRRSDVRELQEAARHNRIRNFLIYAALVLLTILALTALYGAFITGPNERDKIEKAQEDTDRLTDQLAKSNAGLTALMCTGDNRHDTIDLESIDVLVKEEARDVDGEVDLTDSLQELAKQIPPKTNCGELICQFFREVAEPGAHIEIQDPFGPDRPNKPCGKEPPPAGTE